MAKEHSARTEIALPTIKSQILPRANATVHGRSVLFTWDHRDLPKAARRSRLTVKRRKANENNEQAIRHDEIVFEAVVDYVSYFVMPVADIKDPRGDFIWQVAALNLREAGTDEMVALSEHRSFRLGFGQIDLDRLDVLGVRDEAIRTQGLAPSSPPQSADRSSACPNGDLESGTLSGWQAFYGSRYNATSVNMNNLNSGVVTGRHTITPYGGTNDPVLASFGVTLPQVVEGAHAVRLGDSGRTANADVLAYTFVVGAQNQYFGFRFAVVLEEPGGHSKDTSPFFSYYILDGSSIIFGANNWPVAARQILSDPSDPFLKSAGNILYREWTPTCVDLSAHLGKTMTIVFTAADCDQNGHFGYGYIDGLCKVAVATPSFTMSSEVCGSTDVWADGSASTDETSCFWSIEESDAQGGRNPSTEVYEWYVAQQAGQINLSQLYLNKGGHFKCNTYYRIKLAVTNECTPWNEVVHLLRVRCPVVTAGPDSCVSCTVNGAKTHLGVGNSTASGVHYSWTPATGLDNAHSPSPFHAQGSVSYPITYTVIAADDKGCSSSDQVTLYCRPPPDFDMQLTAGCCAARLTASASEYSSITWSTGETGVTSIVVTQPGIYSVTVANACGSKSKSINASFAPGMSGTFSTIWVDAAFSPPTGNGLFKPKLFFVDLNLGVQGVPHAYNATDYKLQIFQQVGKPGSKLNRFQLLWISELVDRMGWHRR